VQTRVGARGGRLRIAVVVAAIGMLGASSVTAGSAGASTPTTASSPSPSDSATVAPHVVRVETKVPPRRKVVRRGFRPWDRPSARRVQEIIRLEAGWWHISAARLSRRVACESRFRWWAANGAYRGLLQFSSSTFYRGMRTIRTRTVKLLRKSSRRVYETRILHYSDGHVERKRGRRHRQVVVRVYTGKLPRRPSVTHGWAQLRIGAQAIRGMSGVSSSEWACPA
jgi:hypothetical protein